MPDPIDLQLEERLRDHAYAVMAALRRDGQTADAARQKTLESLEHAVTTESATEEEIVRYTATVHRAVEWAAQKMAEDKGSELRN